MPTPLDLLRLSEDLRQKKEELFNGQISKEQLKDRVVMQARKKMNLLASAHAFGQSHDLMSEISREELIKMKWAKQSASPENILLKNVQSSRKVPRQVSN